MQVIDELAAASVQRDTVVTIGVFDGVHLGHRYLIERVKASARDRGAASVVITFRNHPLTMLRPEIQILYLEPLGERLRHLAETGVDHVVPVTFTHELSQLTAEEFTVALTQQLHMKSLLVGPDFALGKGRQGTPSVLARLGRDQGFEVEQIDPMELAGQAASSTAIRNALAEGDVQRASEFLGRAYSLKGTVAEGDRRGRTIGFPTANITIAPDLSLPADGVYCTVAEVSGEFHDSVTNIGVRPTFGQSARTVETFILDFEGDLYGQEVAIDLVSRIRPEIKFPGVDALVAQLRKDVQAARKALAGRVPR